MRRRQLLRFSIIQWGDNVWQKAYIAFILTGISKI